MDKFPFSETRRVELVCTPTQLVGFGGPPGVLGSRMQDWQGRTVHLAAGRDEAVAIHHASV